MIQKRLLSLVLCGVLLGIVVAPTTLAQGSSRLSLGECLRTALANNLELVSARKSPEISAQTIEQEAAFFDHQLNASYRHLDLDQEISNLFSNDTQIDDTGQVTVTKELPWGADYSAQFFTGRFERSGPLQTVPTNYFSQIDLQFNLKLLNGRGREANTERLELARTNLDISRETLRGDAHRVLESVEGAYWDVVAAIEGLRIARLSLQRAEDLLVLNRKKVEVGTLAPIEITQAEAGVASQEGQVIVAETDLANAEDELRRLLAIPHEDPMWNRSLIPTDQPAFSEERPKLADALTTALENRPEVASARKTLSNSELSERVAKKKRRHSLDLNLQLLPSGNNFESPGPGPDGIPGTSDDPPPLVEGVTFTSIEEIPKLDNLQWTAGFTYNVPLGNRAAKATYMTAQLTREQSEVDLANQEQTIRVDVRRAVRNVDSGIKRVRAEQANVRLQQKKLEAEQKKFENGMSTSFEVLTFQNDLADAELAQVQAIRDYNKALVALERAKGVLLESRGLSLAE